MTVNKQKMDLCYKKIFKVVVGGEGAVGKTTLCERLAGKLGKEMDKTMTIGIDFHDIRREDGVIVDAKLWDLGGQQQFRCFQESFFRSCTIAIFIFSVEWYDTLICIDFWLDMIKGENPKKIYLIGNKIDSPNRMIPSEEAEEFAKDRGMIYYEVSALKGKGFLNFQNDLIDTIFPPTHKK
ncbi:MAG: GTP-binding protein [Candidatus Lokiarchaeota archaeon]|nr:GTP-binding protein [Candidatus Lokiarchaeota archaeon]